jgi:hypothetical protein
LLPSLFMFIYSSTGNSLEFSLRIEQDYHYYLLPTIYSFVEQIKEKARQAMRIDSLEYS